jgi:sec-independent protein translocase protein TatC
MEEPRMPIGQHLIELRTRLIICIVATLLAMIVAYVFYPDVFYPMIRAPLDALLGDEASNPFVLQTPLLRRLAELQQPSSDKGPGAGPASAGVLHFQSLTTPIVMRLKVSLVIGLLLALPVILYQVWAFVSAGLHAKERRYVLIYGPASFVLFVFGAALAYFVVVPLAVVVLLGQGEAIGLKAILTINEYVPFVLWLLLGFGSIFQMPLVVLFLTKLGLVGPAKLRKGRRYAILGIFIVAAIITPPDPFTQVAIAIPMLALYEVSILLSWLAVRKAAEA